MYHDVGDVLAGRELQAGGQVAEVAVHAAGRDQPHEVQRARPAAALAHAWRKTRFSKKSPSSIALVMRVRS